ncbi:MAG: hypothetical protein Cons2KO_27490 [Congregibacter sp.]
MAALRQALCILDIGLRAVASGHPAFLLRPEVSAFEHFVADSFGALSSISSRLLLFRNSPALVPIKFSFAHASIIGCGRCAVERVLDFPTAIVE